MPSTFPNATGELIAGRDHAPAESALMDVDTVAEMLRCSPRHVYRLSDAGRMPPPVKLGALVRWPRRDVLEWIGNGCPTLRTLGRGK